MSDSEFEFDDDCDKSADNQDCVAWIGTEHFASANKGATSEGGTRGFTIFSTDGTVVWDSGNAVDQMLTSVGHYADESSDEFGIALENVLYADDLQELFLNSEGGHVTIVYNVKNPTNPVFKQVLPSGYRPESSTYVQDRQRNRYNSTRNRYN